MLFKIAIQICGKVISNTSGPVKDKQGKLLTTENEIEQRWTVYFQELLNRPEPDDIPDIGSADKDLDINLKPPTKEEIIKSIKTNGKAPGIDGLSAELFKAVPETAATLFIDFFKKIWEEEEIPSYWKKGKLSRYQRKEHVTT